MDISKLPVGTIIDVIWDDKRKRLPWLDYTKRYIHIEPSWWAHGSEGVDSSAKIAAGAKIVKVLVPKYTEKEVEVEVLDSTEKKYLKTLLKPLRVVRYVSKREEYDKEKDKMVEYLSFRDFGYRELFRLPAFEKGSKYTGMEKDRYYKVTELDIGIGEYYTMAQGREFEFKL